jgi:predicted nucleic acid-binding protein
MAVTLVDSNILLDLATGDPKWLDWSEAALDYSNRSGDLVINAIIYSEVSAAFERIEDADQLMDQHRFRREDVPWAAAFVAAQAFRNYRKQSGVRTAMLPDFLIAAHATLLGYTLLTRDRARFASYFPALRIMSPADIP